SVPGLAGTGSGAGARRRLGGTRDRGAHHENGGGGGAIRLRAQRLLKGDRNRERTGRDERTDGAGRRTARRDSESQRESRGRADRGGTANDGELRERSGSGDTTAPDSAGAGERGAEVV